MLRLRCCFVIFIGAAIAALPAADADKKIPDPKTLPAPQRIVVPKLRGPITIDGELGEAVWAKAARVGPFMKNDGSGREREATIVRVWYDETALYLAWTCTDTDVQATF